MTKPAVTKLLPYAVALTLVSAAAATLTAASAGDTADVVKDQSRHPEIAAVANAQGLRGDVELLPMPDKVRDVIIALPSGKYLVQRYYPSGYSVVFKPQTGNNIAARMYPEGELAQLDKKYVR